MVGIGPIVQKCKSKCHLAPVECAQAAIKFIVIWRFALQGGFLTSPPYHRHRRLFHKHKSGVRSQDTFDVLRLGDQLSQEHQEFLSGEQLLQHPVYGTKCDDTGKDA